MISYVRLDERGISTSITKNQGLLAYRGKENRFLGTIPLDDIERLYPTPIKIPKDNTYKLESIKCGSSLNEYDNKRHSKEYNLEARNLSHKWMSHANVTAINFMNSKERYWMIKEDMLKMQ